MTHNVPNDPLIGGRYLVKDGVRTLLEEPTKDHPEGNRARDEHGKPVAAPDETHANPAPAAQPRSPDGTPAAPGPAVRLASKPRKFDDGAL